MGGAPSLYGQQNATQEVVFHQDFRGKVIDFQSLKFTGAIEQIHEEPEGLRISLPGNNFTPTATGVKTMFPIGGDLEITASYYLLRLDTPPKGTKDGQAGVFLYLRTANPQVAAMLSRFNCARVPAIAARESPPMNKESGSSRPKQFLPRPAPASFGWCAEAMSSAISSKRRPMPTFVSCIKSKCHQQTWHGPR